MITRFLFIIAFVAALATIPFTQAAAEDDVSAASRSVVRVVTVAVVDGQVVGFGHGSGFAISSTRIITNAHVVEVATRYPDNVAVGAVPSEGKGALPARIIAIDKGRDLALIEVSKGTIPPTAIYTGPVEAGMKVTALGYPGNVDAAAARGFLDKIEPRAPVRSDGNISNPEEVNGTPVLTHTAAIARGNSGGPLVDECGRVLGVNTFITRADDGDAPFGFAVMASELSQFLADAGQKASSVGTACIPMDEAEDKAKADAAKSAEEAKAAAEAAKAKADEARERALLEIQSERENRMAIAAVMLVLGALGLGGALVFTQQDKAKQARWLAIGGALLVLGAVAAFLTRPALNPDARLEQSTDDAEDKVPVDATASKAGRSFMCVIDLERSRVTVSQTADVPVSIDGKGCVNDRTQYADIGGGGWQRVLVPNQEAQVSVVDFNPDAGDYRVERFLLGADKMDEARKLRSEVKLKACSSDGEEVIKLGTAQDAVRAILPDAPNERLVYKCTEKK